MIYTTAARNAAINAVAALANGGKLVLHTAAHAVVATCALSATAFAAGVAGVATANAITDDSNAVGGTVTHAHLLDDEDAEILQLSVSGPGGGGELVLERTSVAAGDIIRIDSATITQAAS